MGLVCHSLFAAAGLSAILASSATSYSVVKYVGVVYQIYLGKRSLLDRERFALSSEEVPPLSLRRVYAQAVISNVFSPKIAVFFLATCRSSPTRRSQAASGRNYSSSAWHSRS